MQTSREISNGILRAVFIILLSIGILYLLWEIREIIIYIFISFAFSLMGRPAMIFMNKKLKFSNSLSAIFTLAFFVSLFIGFVLLTIPLITKQAESLSLLNYSELQTNLNSQFHQITEYLHTKGLITKEAMNQKAMLPTIDPTIISGYFGNAFSTLASIGIAVFSIFFITFFFLSDKNLFNQMIISSIPDKDVLNVTEIMSDIKNLLTRYFLGLVLQVIIMFSLYFVILLSFGIHDAFVISFICALFCLIPYFGPWVAMFIIMSLSMSSMFEEGLNINTQIIPNLTWILVFFVIAQVIDNVFNQPLIYAKTVKSHPLEIFIIMLISGILFGILGVVFAVPAYTVLRVILKKFFSNYKIVQSITKNL